MVRFEFHIENTAAAPEETVVAPNPIPAVLPVAFAPLAMVSVLEPMLRVPSVWVTPATAVSVSDVICAIAGNRRVTGKVQSRVVRQLQFATGNGEVPTPSALALVVARSMPLFKVVMPL